MITIEERLSHKLSGLTSLFVSFPYNEYILKVIYKSEHPTNYSVKTKMWECSILSLSYLLDNLTYIDDINLKLLPDDNPVLNQLKPCISYKTKPFDYQLEGIEYGLNHNKWLLLDSPGLGKTLQTIYIAEELHKQRGLEHCLIICGVNSIKSNWQKEINKHSTLSCKILGQNVSKKGNISYSSVDERLNQLKEPIEEFFIITNIETFRKKGAPNFFTKSKNKIDMIVIDECHACKSVGRNGSKQANNILNLDAQYKIAATGTLLLNSPIDAYAMLKWTGNDHSTKTHFEEEYVVKGGFGGTQIVGYKNLELLKEELARCSLRRLKSEVLKDLPTKTIINEYVDLDDEHKAFYTNIKNGVKEEANKIELKRNNVLAMVTRLRQASVLPFILTTNKIDSNKIERAVDLTKQLLSQGEKVTIMSTYKEPIYELQRQLKEYDPIVCTGDSKQDAFTLSNQFQTDDSKKLFLATWQKCGVGIDLYSASYMIFLDTPYTWGIYTQVQDRIYRIGTKKPVFIYNLVCRDTIDEHVLDILETKKSLSDFILDDDMDESTLDNLRNYIQNL